MAHILNPDTLRPLQSKFDGVYAHSKWISRPERLVSFAGQIGVAMDGTTLPTFEEQCHQAMDYVEALLEAHQLNLSDIIKVTYYVTRPDDLPALTAIRQERWHSDMPPAVTTLVVAGLATPELLVEIDVLAGR